MRVAASGQVRDQRKAKSETLGLRWAQRNLGGLSSGERTATIVLIVATASAILAISLTICGIGPLVHPMSKTSRAVIGVILYGALITSIAVGAGTFRPSDQKGPLRYVSRIVGLLLPAASLVLIAFTILAMDEDQRTSPRPEWAIIRAVAWVAFGVACVYVLRPLPSPSGLVCASRALRVLVPATLWVAVLGVTKAMGVYSMGISALLLPALFAMAVVGISLAIGATIAGALGALENTRQRGQAVTAFVGVKKRRIFIMIAAKCAALVLVWVAYRVVKPEESIVVLSRPAVIMATIAALVAVALFAVDSRIKLSASGHGKAAQYGGVLVGSAVGFALTVVFAIALMATIITVRWAYILGVLALVVFALVVRRARASVLIGVGYPGVLVAAVLISLVLGHGHRIDRPIIDPANKATMQLLTAFAALIAVVVFIAAAVWLVVVAIRRRRFGWLTYVLTVVIWNVIVSWWNSVSAIEFMNFDIALTVLLAIAALLLVLGIQRVIDGFEIAVSLAVTFLLIEGPMIADLLPTAVGLVPVVLAVVGPGVTVVWKALAALSNEPTRRAGMVKLATASVVYCGVAAVLWQIAFDVPDYLRTVSDFSLSVLAIPLLLLLVAAHNPTRQQ